MDKKVGNRLHALDGLRGLSMILVFLNHVNPHFIIAAFPFLDWIGLFSSGVTGVSLLFILSGFLMAYLYPQPQDGFTFLQKRYTRIFPLFLSMCAFMLFFFLFPLLAWYHYLLVLFTIAVFTHYVWVYGIQKIQTQQFSRILFFLFLTLQAGIGILYAFWIMRKPPLYFDQILPHPFKVAFIGLTNATLTFPLGNYIPMLDGVYWSLAAEILFYVLYPFIITPLVYLLLQKTRTIKILFLFSLIPFLAGIDILSHHIFVLSALQFSLFFYFATGIALAYLYKNHKPFFNKIPGYFSKKTSILFVVCFFASLTIIHLINSIADNSFGPLTRLLFAIPLTCLIGIALNAKTSLGKVLSNKFLVFIGALSYSIYLSHAAVIHIVTSVFPVTTISSNIAVLLVSFLLAISVSWVLYALLEKPYFSSPHRKSREVVKLKKPLIKRAKRVIVGIIFLYGISIFFAFQSNFNFFSKVVESPTRIVLPSHPGKMIVTKDTPHSVLLLKATDNNLGIIAVKIAHHKTQKKLPLGPLLTFHVTDKATGKLIYSADYVLDEFRGVDFPFGFPSIQDAKNKTYQIEFTLIRPSIDDFVTIDTSSIKTIYQSRKESIIKNPFILSQLLINKIQTIFISPMAIITFLLFIPFIIISFIMLVVV